MVMTHQISGDLLAKGPATMSQTPGCVVRTRRWRPETWRHIADRNIRARSPFRPPTAIAANRRTLRAVPPSVGAPRRSGAREDAAIFFEPAYWLAESCAARSIEREAPEIDAGLLTDLHERQAEVGIVMEWLRTDFVEDRRSAVVVAASDEEPNQFGHALRWADGIPERDPRAPLRRMMNASRRSSKIRALSSR